MYLVLDPSQVKSEYILTHAPIKNTAMENSDFIRILYSDGVVALNGLHARARLHISRVEQYFNKYKCTIDVPRSSSGIRELAHLEDAVLKQSGVRNKNPVRRIADQLRLGSFKLFSDNPGAPGSQRQSIYVLKMSGVWETAREYGVTHKFMEIALS